MAMQPRSPGNPRPRLLPFLVLLSTLAAGAGWMGMSHAPGVTGVFERLGAPGILGGLASPLAAQVLPPDPGQGGDPEGGDGPGLQVKCQVIQMRFEMEGWTVVRSCIRELCRIHDAEGDLAPGFLGRVSWLEEECDAPGTHEIPAIEGMPFFPPRW